MYKKTRWYRLLQVVYGVLLSASLFIGIAWAYQEYGYHTVPFTFEEFKLLRSGGEVTPRTEGSWMAVTVYSIGTSIIIVGIFLILRKLFFYIYEGRSLFEKDSTQRKKTILDITRVILYLFLTLFFFFTWGLRKDLGITGFFSAILHFAIFWGLFVLIRKKVRAGSEEIKDGVTNGEKSFLKVILLSIGISLSLFILAPLFF